MTQTITLDNILIVLQGLGVIALTYGLPALGVLGAMAAWRRSKVRYHVGHPRVNEPVRTFRTKAAARKARMEGYQKHRKAFQITTTR